tara:strand:- start:5477 stop:6694 length:1218 start_codon:yes stop_codon:yes gene_type:complete
MKRFLIAVVLLVGLGYALGGGFTSNASQAADAEAVARAAHEREQSLQSDVARLETTNNDLRRMMAEMEDRRLTREQRWLEYTNLVAELPIPDVPERPGFFPVFEPEVQAVNTTSVDPRQQRADRILMDLRAFLTVEHVGALDLLEIGLPEEGWTGPVVVRLIDNRGRPSGMLAADRLHLECSRAGHSVTLVFQNGYEMRDGLKVPFGRTAGPTAERGGVRRVPLFGIDPEPWLEALPELFDPSEIDVIQDDGRWDLGAVRAQLNQLLASDNTTGHWRLAAMGGVSRDVLTDVQLVELGQDDAVVRRIFADDLTLQPHGTGVSLVCTDGVQMRGSTSTPFLEGRYTLYLPQADVQEWRLAGLPGFVSGPVLLGRKDRKPALGAITGSGTPLEAKMPDRNESSADGG